MNEGQEFVRFNTVGASVAGALCGAAIAIGVPWVVLAHGGELGGGVQTGLVIAAVAVGGLTTMMSAFFGLVMPSQVGHRGHLRHRHRFGPGGPCPAEPGAGAEPPPGS